MGGSLSDKADEAWAQMLKAENEVNEIKKLTGKDFYFTAFKQKLNTFSASDSKI